MKIIDNDVIGDSDDDEEDENHISSQLYPIQNNEEGEERDNVQDINSDQDINKCAISHSYIYEVSLDDLKFAFFLKLFPQLHITHHLVYCQNSYNHYYYQNYFSSTDNKYEWIQTDVCILCIL